MSISYHRNDELPVWQATVTLNRVAPDFSSGWTFVVTVGGTTKTTGILGFADGVVQVHWVNGDLDLEPGNYDAQLVGTRTADGAEFTVVEDLILRPRAA